MRCMLLLLLVLPAICSAQYWIGFENDLSKPVTELSIWQSGTDLTGNVLPSPLAQGEDYTYPSLSAGDYFLVAADVEGYVYQVSFTVPPGVAGGLVFYLSQFPYALAPPPTQPKPKHKHTHNESCSTSQGASLIPLAVLFVIMIIWFRPRDRPNNPRGDSSMKVCQINPEYRGRTEGQLTKLLEMDDTPTRLLPAFDALDDDIEHEPFDD